MDKNLCAIGGDLRIVKLIEMLAKDEFKVYTYSIENAEHLKQHKNVEQLDELSDLSGFDVIIGGVPFSSNNVQINNPFSDKVIDIEDLFKSIKGKTFIAGHIQENVQKLALKYNIKVIDILEREELAVLNTISTAEGAIQIAMEETSKTLHGNNILITGFGRVGKMLAKMCYGIGAHTYCQARKKQDIAWIKAYGYNPIELSKLTEHLNKFDIIFNTIPAIILKEKQIKNIKKECLYIELASSPGGIEIEQAKKIGLKYILAQSLPGKVAPTTSAEFIKETIYNIFDEIKQQV